MPFIQVSIIEGRSKEKVAEVDSKILLKQFLKH